MKKKFGLVDVLLESFGQTSVTPLPYKRGVPKYAWNIVSMGGCVPLSPVENSMAVRLSKWGEWGKWLERDN